MSLLKNKKQTWVLSGLFLLALVVFYQYGRRYWGPLYTKLRGRRTVADVVDLYQNKVDKQLAHFFAKNKQEFPPKELKFLAFKEEKQLEIWIKSQGKWYLLKSYPIIKASGTIGPKLKEGDHQVPEGFYQIALLNPNSSYHLSLKINYPNKFDRKIAQKEERTDLGGDIFIHGKDLSVGCLAMGDKAIEEIFVLAALAKEKIEVIISPVDFRKGKKAIAQYKWGEKLYQDLQRELEKYK